MNTIGEKIAELRKNRKMTQEELAGIVGVSAQSVSKWENSQTMPDIMLLPTLASALDVTVNDLFSIVSCVDHYESIHPDKAPEYAYRELVKALQQGLCDRDSLPREEIVQTIARLGEGENGQSGLVGYDHGEMSGAVYANRNIALSFVKSKADALALLEDEKAAGILSVLADANARKALRYMLTNGNAMVTAAVTASKCGITESEAETALNRLASVSRMVQAQQVDTGEEKPLCVYQLAREYKVDMTVYPLLELARVLGEWHEGWLGLRW